MTYGFHNINGVSKEIVSYRSNQKIGRLDLRVQGFDGTAVKLEVQELQEEAIVAADPDAEPPVEANDGWVTLGEAMEIAAGGGIATLSVNSNRKQLRVISSADNAGEAFVRVDANFLGAVFMGQMDEGVKTDKVNFDGENMVP